MKTCLWLNLWCPLDSHHHLERKEWGPVGTGSEWGGGAVGSGRDVHGPEVRNNIGKAVS